MVEAGDVIAGKYRVERVLGKGGMGVVVAATHMEIGEPRAIKLLTDGVLGDRESLERFRREARAAGGLRSPHAVKVFDIVTTEPGPPYIVMEHLDGVDLRMLSETRGPLPVAEAVRYVVQACEAVGEAHDKGIVHRDLKPANLFLTADFDGMPCVKVLDFGIAKVPDPTATGAPLTSTLAVLGTPLFMSPEQFESTRSVDARADIWSLGVILYNLLTGRLPFEAPNIHLIIAAVLQRPPTPIEQWRTDLPRELGRTISRCLEKDPALRPQSVAELEAALRPFDVEPLRPLRLPMRVAAVPPAATESDAVTRVKHPALTETVPGRSAVVRLPLPSPLAPPDTPVPAASGPQFATTVLAAGSDPPAQSGAGRPRKRVRNRLVIGGSGAGVVLVVVILLSGRSRSTWMRPAPTSAAPEGTVFPPDVTASAVPPPQPTGVAEPAPIASATQASSATVKILPARTGGKKGADGPKPAMSAPLGVATAPPPPPAPVKQDPAAPSAPNKVADPSSPFEIRKDP